MAPAERESTQDYGCGTLSCSLGASEAQPCSHLSYTDSYPALQHRKMHLPPNFCSQLSFLPAGISELIFPALSSQGILLLISIEQIQHNIQPRSPLLEISACYSHSRSRMPKIASPWSKRDTAFKSALKTHTLINRGSIYNTCRIFQLASQEDRGFHQFRTKVKLFKLYFQSVEKVHVKSFF